jgi:hypothetical protein
MLSDKPVRTSLLVVLILIETAAYARAQNVGARAGISGNPDQFYIGVHYQTDELVEHLRFRPNVELGLGNDQTIVAINFEFLYSIPVRRKPLDVYVGAGPALNIIRFNSNTSPEGGFNFLVGAAHHGGLFTELKVGTLRSPSVKFGVGYTFH